LTLSATLFLTAFVACGSSDSPSSGELIDSAGGAADGGSAGSTDGGQGGTTAGSGGAQAGSAGKAPGGAGGAAGAPGGAGGSASGSGGSTAGTGGVAAGAGGSIAGAGGSIAGAGGDTQAGAGGTTAGAGGSIAGSDQGGAGTGGSSEGGAAGSPGGAGGEAAGGASAGAGGTMAGGAGGTMSGGATRLRIVLLSNSLLNFPVDICYGQGLTTPNGDDPGYVGPVASDFTETLVSPTVTRYVSDSAATPLKGGVPLVIRVVKPFTDCTKANRVVSTKDDAVATIVEGADNTVVLVDHAGATMGLQAQLVADAVAPAASAALRVFNGVHEKPLQVYAVNPNDSTDFLVESMYGQAADLSLTAGKSLAGLLVTTAGSVSAGIHLPGPTFAGGATYSVFGVGVDTTDPVTIFAAVCQDDKTLATKSNLAATGCEFSPNPEGGP
jgi:hypothetical protein